MIRGILMAALLLSLGRAGAPAGVSGTWQVTMDGEKRPIEGTLVLQLKGAQVTGTWTSIDAWTMTGRADETGRFALESETRPVPMTNGAKKGTIDARWVFRGVLRDGALSGTASIEFESSEPRIRKCGEEEVAACHGFHRGRRHRLCEGSAVGMDSQRMARDRNAGRWIQNGF